MVKPERVDKTIRKYASVAELDEIKSARIPVLAKSAGA